MKTAYEYSVELIKKINPEMSYKNENAMEWQAKAREKLYSLLGLENFKKVASDIEIEYDTENDIATEIKFTFQSEDGYRIPCNLMLPKGIDTPPLVICLQGHSKGMHISLGRPKYEGDEKSISGDRDFVMLEYVMEYPDNNRRELLLSLAAGTEE